MRGHRKKKHQKNSQVAGETSQPSESTTATNPRLKALILEVVDNQIRANDPPETRQTYQRLLAAGYSRKLAAEMIGSALTEEIWEMLHEHKLFDRARFKGLLDQLS